MHVKTGKGLKEERRMWSVSHTRNILAHALSLTYDSSLNTPSKAPAHAHGGDLRHHAIFRAQALSCLHCRVPRGIGCRNLESLMLELTNGMLGIEARFDNRFQGVEIM
jgi:hypothetical protein